MTLFQIRDDLIVNVSDIKSATPEMVTLYGGISYSITLEQWDVLKGIAEQPRKWWHRFVPIVSRRKK